ncbi:uncharacterized protein LOC143026055 isoform X2 [Oratosquilla oratoria]|uniref:uncharacterized protein LOC143026055 isoform X2 n=1 Tax=Oratosquilla oratoria TaxID=337810 RepID=UPI003F76D562
MEELSGFDVSSFYSRAVSRQMCRENSEIMPIEQDNGLSDESDGEEEEEVELDSIHTPSFSDFDQEVPPDVNVNERVDEIIIDIPSGHLEEIEEIQDSIERPSTSTQASRPSRRRFWTRKTEYTPSPLPNFVPGNETASVNSDLNPSQSNPLWYFTQFFTPDFLDMIVYQSNLYATQKM